MGAEETKEEGWRGNARRVHILSLSEHICVSPKSYRVCVWVEREQRYLQANSSQLNFLRVGNYVTNHWSYL